LKAQFCQSCGTAVGESSISQPAAEAVNKNTTQGQGLAITGIVLGAIALVLALLDIIFIWSGEYDYITAEEVGLLFLLSVVGLVFSILALAKKNSLASTATALSGSALFVVLALTIYGYY